MCISEATCPSKTADDGSPLVASSCTSDSLAPRAGEATKRFGCFCGGIEGDAFTANICDKQQPHTNWMFELLPAATGGALNQTNFTMSMYERAGTPANVRALAAPRGHASCSALIMLTARALAQTFAPLEKWKFAYPDVLDGTLTECAWSEREKCVFPLQGADCFKITCQHIDVHCPPEGQPVCPHYTGVSCGWMPGSTKPYWQLKCNPLAIPSPTKVTFVTCKPQPRPDGSFQCYFGQVPPPPRP